MRAAFPCAGLLFVATLFASSCSSDGIPAGRSENGPTLTVAVAPLTLEGVAAADYRLTVKNGTEVVWTKDLSSTTYGNGQGSLSYVGTCDAAAAQNTAELTILELRDELGTTITAWTNPTLDGPLVKSVPCVANADNAVTFNVTVARSAVQGFFDVAVSFSDIFCSAKVDCSSALLDGPSGRGPTAILALACTGDPDGVTPTVLYMNDVTVTCTGAGYGALVDPSLGPGLVTPTTNNGPTLYGAAVYRGDEQLAAKAYWNVALGIAPSALTNAGTCTLSTRATASSGALPNDEIPAGEIYPYIEVNAPIVTAGALCGNTGLDTAIAIRTRYTDAEGAALPFTYAYEQGNGGAIVNPGGGGNPPTGAQLVSDKPLARAALVTGNIATPSAPPTPNAAAPVTYLVSSPLAPTAGGITATVGDAATSAPGALVDTTVPFTANLTVSATFPTGTPRCEFQAPYDDMPCTLDGNAVGGASLPSTSLLPGETLVADVYAAETPSDLAQTNALETDVLTYRQVASINETPNDSVQNVVVAGDGVVYYSARTSLLDTQELWVYRPTTDTAVQLVDLHPGASDGAKPLAVTPGYVYFIANAVTDAGTHLYAYELPSGPTRELLGHNDFSNGAVAIPYGDDLIVSKTGAGALYRYSHSANTLTDVSGGTSINVNVGEGRQIAVAHDKLYFRANCTDGSWNGLCLWQYDLTAGTLGFIPNTHWPTGLVTRGNTVYTGFSAAPNLTTLYTTRYPYKNSGSGWVRLTDGFATTCKNAGFVEDGTDVYIAGALTTNASSSCTNIVIARVDTTLTTGNVSVVGGSVGTEFYELWIDSTRSSAAVGGWVFYVDQTNTVRAIDTTSNTAVVAGSGSVSGPFAVGSQVYDIYDSSRPRLRALTPSSGSIVVTDVATTVSAAPNAGTDAYFAAFGTLRRYDFSTLPTTSAIATSIGTTGTDDPNNFFVFGGDLYLGARYDGDVMHTAAYQAASSDGAIATLPTSNGFPLGVGKRGIYYRTVNGPARWDGASMTPLGLSAQELTAVTTDGTTTWALTTLVGGATANDMTLSTFDELTGQLTALVQFDDASGSSPQSLLVSGGRVFVVVSDNNSFQQNLWAYDPAHTPAFYQVTTSGGPISWDQVQSPMAGPDGWVYFTDYDASFSPSLFATNGVVVKQLPAFGGLSMTAQSLAGFGGVTYLGASDGIYRWNGSDLVLVAIGPSGAALEVYGGHVYALVTQLQASSDPAAWTQPGLYRLGDHGWELLIKTASGTTAALKAAGGLLYTRLPDTMGNTKLFALCDATTGCDPVTVTSP